ncbi:MAG: Uma2 family endonuclease [Myxococcota bacterium]
MVPPRTLLGPGPFRVEQLPERSSYELSNGHAILCAPTGRRGGRSNLIGGEVLDTDPAVKSAGVDVGFSPSPGDMRAPDISVGDFSNEPGWAPGAPPLAVEYADTGQDEDELQLKVGELLAAGTKFLWVVRLVGPRRVEIHEPGKQMRLAHPGDELVAPGILHNPVRVEALFDRDAAHEATLRNLLQRRGYESLDEVRRVGVAEGVMEGYQDALLAIMSARALELTDEQRRLVLASTDPNELTGWIARAATAESTSEIFG